MGLIFKKIITVSFLHDFFIAQNADYIRWGLTGESQQVLSGRRMIVKDTPNGFHIFSKADDAGNFITDPVGASLTFVLSLSDVSFLNYTDLHIASVLYGTGNILYYRNNPVTTGTLSPALIDQLRPTLFSYSLPLTAANSTDTATLVVKDSSGTVQTFDPPIPGSIAPDQSMKYAVRLNFEGKPSGTYSFISQNASGTKTQKVYIDDALSRENVFALLQVDITSGLDFSTGAKEYTISFSRNTAQWTYYVVNKSNISLTDFDLLLVDSNPAANPGGTAYTFAQALAPPDQEVDGTETVVFSSNQVISYSDMPKTGLKLSQKEKSSGTELVLVENLPNPPREKVIENGTVKIYVFV